MRALWIGLGTLFVAIGALGVVLPLLPHTIFFLLAAACYARGSERAHTWLMTNRFFGRYLRNYSEHRGATPGTKAVTIAMLWIGLALSAWLLAPSPRLAQRHPRRRRRRRHDLRAQPAHPARLGSGTPASSRPPRLTWSLSWS